MLENHINDIKNHINPFTVPQVTPSYIILKCLNRAQRFTPTTTHGSQKKTGGAFDWSVIVSKWKIQ